MRQLSSLDAQFLNVESARIYGHVAFLGIYDPSTAPGGKLGADEVKQLLEERAAPAAAAALAARARCRSGIDLPYWADDPDFDLDFHVRETAIPPPGDDRQLAETVAARVRPPAGPRPAAVGALRHPRAVGRARGAADQDPPLGRRRHLGQRDHGRAAGPRADGARDRPAAAPGTARRRPIPRDRADARARPARHPAPAAARAALAARPRSPASPTCPAPTRCRACRRSRTSTRACGGRSAPTRAPACSR